MALVTNPYATSTAPHNSYSDDGNTDDEEAAKVNQSRLNECGTGTATLMLGSNKRLRASCEEQHLSRPAVNDSVGNGIRPQQAPGGPDGSAPNSDGARSDSFEGEECGEARNGGGDAKCMPYASRPASSCSSGSCSSSSEIQQHLQSMFSLLRPEETLKMAVKLESLRPGRTRYLVVVSRSVSSKRHNTCTSLLSAGSSGNLNSLSWPSTVSLQSSRPGSVQPGLTLQPTAARLGTVAPVDLGGALGVNTFVSSLDHCLLSSTSSSSSSGSGSGSANGSATAASQQPSFSRPSAPGERPVSCGNDECDSKTNTRLSRNNTSVAEADGTTAAGTASGRFDDANALDRPDLPNGVGGFSSLGQQQQHFQQSSYAGGFDVSGGAGVAADGGKEIEESCLLGIDCNERTTVGLVLKVLADTSIRLDGDGGFSVSSCGKQHIFKPVSVQAMWSALQTLHKFSSKAREHNFFAGGPSHDWVAYYETHIDSDRSCLNEWNAMDSLESRRPPSPGSIRSKPTKREETESVIRSKLKEVMMSVDLDDVTSKFIRGRLEELLDMDLGEYKPFIDGEMLVILGQMDAPTEIFDHVYLGSEWNASNLEELQRNGVRHILNVTREIDNFFPGLFNYFNVRVYDDEKTDLLRHWDNTFKYISRAKMEGSKVLVHCKMGISRSASVVIAYAMKANNWDFQQALQHVKEKRNCIKPNKNFLMQLETYQGMLDAMKNKEKLQRSKSETNLKLAGVKEGRSLPGSEPTPLIQALSGATGASGSHGLAGSKRHTVGAVRHKLDSQGSASGSSKTAHELDGDGVDAHRPTQLADGDGPEAGQGQRGRSRTRQHKHPHQQHQPKEQSLPHDQQQQQKQEQEQEQEEQQKEERQWQHTVRPLFNESWRGFFSQHSGAWPEGNHRDRLQTCAAGGSSSSLARSVKRHKSLSPDTAHPRWVSSHEAATLAASLGLPEPAEPVPLVDRGASEPRASRRKQQSYSLEHLHGLLEMRSPCAETKTIRMPCGNGQNYSVSPNQIVHLQDKLPLATSGRDVPKAKRTDSFQRHIFATQYDPTAASDATTQCTSTASSAPTTTTTTATTVPSTSSSAGAPSSVSSPATAATQLPSVFSVKTIVCELESSTSSTSSTSSSNRSGHIPVAPPPSADSGAASTAPSNAAIPIASIAAEAAAVAFRKEHGSGSGDSPLHHEPPICWTSSAQIIQQTSTTMAIPERQEDADRREVEIVEDASKRKVKEEASEREVTCPTDEPSRSVRDGENGVDSSTRHEGAPPVDPGSTEPAASSRPRSCGGALEASDDPGQPLANDEPQSTRGVQRRPDGASGSFAVDSTTEHDIPWHPGTVRRTKEKIEERSSSQRTSVALKRTGSSCSTELASASAAPREVLTVSPLPDAHTTKPVDPTADSSSSLHHRGRRGMVSTSYARLSASAPDSYNMYAGPGIARTTGTAPTVAATATAADTPSTSQSAAPDGSMQPLVRFRTSIHGRASISVGGGASPHHRRQDGEQQQQLQQSEPEQTGKVRNLKMSFEAKSHDRRREQKKVRSLPSSPVAVHAQMTAGQPRPKPDSPDHDQLQQQQPASSTVAKATTTLVRQPSLTAHDGSPLEDVTVRDLVDRYEVHGPRARTSSNGGAPTGSTSTTTTTTTISAAVVPALSTVVAAPPVSRQRPRSVFEPLKSQPASSASSASSSSGLLFAGKVMPHLLSHATAPFRLEEFSRPPVPPAVPLVRGLVNPPGDLLGLNNNGATNVGAYGSPTAANSNARNNNNGDAALGDGSSRKRAQQHGRTHPLAKISPSSNASKQQQQQQQQQQQHHHHHHHHNHHHHHQYGGIGGQLQQHRLATGLVAATAQTAGVPGGPPAGPPAAANVYNTM